MGRYMYPITIKREPQKVRYSKKFELKNDVLTLAELRKFVSEDEFFSMSDTNEGLHSKTMLYVNGTRLETQEEVDARVKKEEEYMENYTKFHSNKKK